MRNFYIVVPALSLLNMGVNGATIANTLTARGDAHAEGNGLYKAMFSHHQNRQIHTADFSSGPDADAGAEVQTPDHPATPASESESLTPRDALDDIAPRDLTNHLAADALSSLRSREVQPAMVFKRHLNGPPHEMARHVRRQKLANVLGGASSGLFAAQKMTNNGVGTALVMTEGLMSKDAINKSLSAILKTDSPTLSKGFNGGVSPLNGLIQRHSSTGPYQRYEECDENLGERASESDTEPLAVSRGMHELRQVGLTSESIMDNVPFADLTLGSRSDDSADAKLDYRNMFDDLPTIEGNVQKRPTISALARDIPMGIPAPLSSVTGSLPVFGGAAGRRALGDDARGSMKVAKFKSLPVVDANYRRADVSRMIKRKAMRQDEDEAGDAEMAADMAADDAEASADNAGEGAGSLDDVD